MSCISSGVFIFYQGSMFHQCVNQKSGTKQSQRLLVAFYPCRDSCRDQETKTEEDCYWAHLNFY